MKRLPVKITPPNADFLVPVPRLMEYLDRCRRGITWISGKPGSGKTSLVASWIRQRGFTGIWYNLDQSDEDVTNFFHFLKMAADHCPAFDDLNLPSYRSDLIREPFRFARLFFDELEKKTRQDWIFVLDDLQKIPDNSPIHDILSSMMVGAGGSVRFIGISHKRPHAPYIALRSKGRVDLVKETQLQLSREETGLLIQSVHQDAAGDTIKTIHDMTAGWAAGVLILSERISFQNPGHLKLAYSPGVKELNDYFTQVVFKNFSLELREFLMMSSLFPQFNPGLIQRLLPANDSEGSISYLLHNHLFIEELSVNHNASWFTYHPLFRSFLIKEAEKSISEDIIRFLKREAADNYMDQGFPEEAADLLCEIHDRERLWSVIETIAEDLIHSSRYERLKGYLECYSGKSEIENPHYYYWMGRATQPFDLYKGQEFFDRGFQLARSQADYVTLFKCWQETVLSIVYKKDYFTSLHTWLVWLEDNKEILFQHTPLAVQVNVISAYLVAIMYADTPHASISFWQEKALSIFKEETHPQYLIPLGLALFIHNITYGDFVYCHLAIETLSPIMDGSRINIFIRIRWFMILSWYHYSINGELEEALRSSEIAEDLAGQSGVDTFTFDILMVSTLTLFNLDNDEKLKARLQQFLKFNQINARLRKAQIHQVLTFHEIHRDNILLAWQYCDSMLSGNTLPTSAPIISYISARHSYLCIAGKQKSLKNIPNFYAPH